MVPPQHRALLVEEISASVLLAGGANDAAPRRGRNAPQAYGARLGLPDQDAVRVIDEDVVAKRFRAHRDAAAVG